MKRLRVMKKRLKKLKKRMRRVFAGKFVLKFLLLVTVIDQEYLLLFKKLVIEMLQNIVNFL